MLFSSYEFVLVFLPAFLVCFYLTQTFSGPRQSEWVILGFSFIFYSVFSIKYAGMLLASITGNFILGKFISNPNQPNRKALLTIGICLNLLSIAYYKYANFFLENISFIAGVEYSALAIILPIGISFFTFQQIAYLVDVYKHGNPDYNLKQYAIFVSFFPQLVAGPIVHHRPFMQQMMAGSYGISPQKVILGLSIFFIGLFKKVVLADSFALSANRVFEAAEAGKELVFSESWVGAISYSLQIYFDFSGYSDMAIGLALCIGLQLPLNFNSPYKATSIIDFWRTWHITLSNFLRDYVYIPLGGNRLGNFRRYQNLIIVMLVGGLWHGASWTFVVWGGLHGIYLMINHLWRKIFPSKSTSSIIATAFYWLITMLAVVIAWVFFRAESFNAAIAIIKSMLLLSPDFKLLIPFSVNDKLLAAGVNLHEIFTAPGLIFQNVNILDEHWLFAKLGVIAGILIVILLPNTLQLFTKTLSERFNFEGFAVKKPLFTWQQNIWWGLSIGVMMTIAMIMLSESTEFIYFEF